MTQWPLDALKPYHRQEEMFPEDKINPAKFPATPGRIALLMVNTLQCVRPEKMTEFFGHHQAFVKLLTGELPQKGED
jgi:hypothetical protein